MNSLLSILMFITTQALAVIGKCGRSQNDQAFPWNVGIFIGHEKQLELICFGTIIHPNAVITAAHCFCNNLDGSMRNESFYVSTDYSNKKINVDEHPHFHKINKNNINVHKYYKGLVNQFANDIAIIKDKFQLNNKSICIDWSGDITKDKNIIAKQSVLDNNEVRIVDFTYLDSDECIHEASDFFRPLITNDKFCTKIAGVSLSHTSEGAGLAFLHENKWYLKGVVSTHDVTKSKLSTITPLSQYMTWISNIYATV
ncbi:plasma kallikrein-like [Tribolium madens]|uniref:plasma kallikrein-like n=1 Tax=Tribolium madens TaxID=41895 RepID=UPI001CF7665C|nr:plasma kallikrein-like [Tribolium madens]